MCSMLNSQGMALATAMAAVSGTVILLSFCIQKSIPSPHFSIHPTLRSCIPSETRKREKRKKKQQQKRVHFAEDVVDPIGNGEDFRRNHEIASNNSNSTSSPSTPAASPLQKSGGAGDGDRGMPANRVALYNGILRDRVVHRLAYSC